MPDGRDLWTWPKGPMLVCRLAWNHPLPDGNKPAAWASVAMFP